MFLMPARAVTQNYKMTLKTSVSKGHSYFGEVGLIILTLLGLKYLPGWVKLVWLFHPCRSKSANTFFRRFSALSRLFPSICTFRAVASSMRFV